MYYLQLILGSTIIFLLISLLTFVIVYNVVDYLSSNYFIKINKYQFVESNKIEGEGLGTNKNEKKGKVFTPKDLYN